MLLTEHHSWIREDLRALTTEELRGRIDALHKEREALEFAEFVRLGDGSCCGPNDGAYMNGRLLKAAENLRSAAEFYCGYSHHRCLTSEHPIVKCLEMLRQMDAEECESANRRHDPKLFALNPGVFETPDEFWKRMKSPSTE